MDSVEFVLRKRLASPFAMAFLVAGGWYDEACTYSCLLVGLICVLTSRIPVEVNFSPLYTVTSRNVTSVLLASYVNLIVSWIGLFLVSVKVFSIV